MALSNHFQQNHQRTTKWSISLLFLVLFLLFSCQEDGASHLASEIQSCRDLFNQRSWDDAIEACEDAGTDETLHYAAQAYMARSGVSLFEIMLAISDSTEDPSKIMYDKIPDTAAKRSDCNKALSIIMDDIEVKTEDMYLESLILSGLLVFDQLKTLLVLDWDTTNEVFTTCADDSSCTYTPDATNDGTDDILLFSGLGSTLYTSICGDSSSDVYNNADLGEGFNRDGTVFKCTIQSDSLLDYNNIAVNAYYAGGSTEIKDAMLPFKFYENMDQGGNVSEDVGAPINAVYFCDDAVPLYTPEPTSDDRKLSDCEILSYLTDPGF